MKPLILSILATLISHAAPVALTDTLGRTITVEVLALADSTLKVRKADGLETLIPLAKLTEESRKVATDAAASVEAGVASGIKLTSVSNAIGKVTDKSWETSWGSYDKEIFRSRGVVITVVADTVGKAILEMHWIGSVAGHASDRGVVIFTKKEITLAAREKQSHEFAALFVENDANYKALGVRNRDGLKYAGWVARVITPDGKVLATIAARPPLVGMIAAPDPTREEFP